MDRLLLDNVKKHVELSAEEKTIFTRAFTPQKLSRKTFLLRAGEICNFEAFVTKGCFRVYHLTEKGQEYILYFAIADWWLTDIDSFNNQKPTRLYIEALEDSEVLLIYKPAKDQLYREVAQLEKLFRIMTQKAYVSLQQRVLDNLSKSATDRYFDFMSRYPAIAGRLTNVQIASYLGISHEFVSKIKNRKR